MDASFARYRGYIAMTIVFLLVLIGTVYSLQRREPPTLVITTPTARATPTEIFVVVDVRGAVANPGVYTLTDGSRVKDALASAGNALSNADLSVLNLARKLSDGDQIFVPKIADASASPFSVPVSATPKPASGCLSYKDALTHLNEMTCVRGTVASAEKSGSVFYIYFDDTATSFYAVSFGRTWENLRNRCVEISGRIALYRNRAQIVLDTDDQLSLCK